MYCPLQGVTAGEAGSGGEEAGPTSFANLRQLAGMPAPGPKPRKRGGGTLVSRLKAPAHRSGKEPAGSGQASQGASADAAAAAVAILAAGGRGAK